MAREMKTMKAWRIVPAFALLAFGVLANAGPAAASPPPYPGHTYTCDGSGGGVIPPGNYNSMLVTGVCYMPAGHINIGGNLTIASGALLDAVSPGDPVATPILPAIVTIAGNISVGSDGVLLLGCSPNASCPQGVTPDRVGGNVTANNALGVVIHSTTIGGNVSVNGGGGGVAGAPLSGACFDTTDFPPPAPWISDPNLAGIPVYTDAEDSTIGGNYSFTGIQSCWLGTLRDQIRGNATFAGNQMSDPDAMEVNNDLVGGNMSCFGNLPAVQFGEGGQPSIVGGWGLGECGFNVLLPNPAPEAGGPVIIPSEHITVSAWSLRHYSGLRTVTSDLQIPFGVTVAGDTLLGDLNTAVYSGSGLTGNVSGKALLTSQANGWTTFLDLDTCTCTFAGQNGTITIRAYGTIAPNGTTWGTFLVTADGGITGDPLTTLAGWGTFSSWGQPSGTLRLDEFLKIT